MPHVVGTLLGDTTGCGDSFAGAFLIGSRFVGLSAVNAIDYAVRAAAKTATEFGVGDALPYSPDRQHRKDPEYPIGV